MADERRPTIAELEDILRRDDNPPIEILPDGSIAMREGDPRASTKPRIYTLGEVLGDNY